MLMNFAVLLTVLSLPQGDPLDEQGQPPEDSPAPTQARVERASAMTSPYLAFAKSDAELDAKAFAALQSDITFDDGEVTLDEFVSSLNAKLDVPVVIQTQALDDLGLGVDEVVRPIPVRFPLRRHLDIICENQIGDLVWLVDRGVISITTNEEVYRNRELQIYDVTDLVSERCDDDLVAYREVLAKNFEMRSEFLIWSFDGKDQVPSESRQTSSSNHSYGDGSGGGFFQFGGRSQSAEEASADEQSSEQFPLPTSTATRVARDIDRYDVDELIDVIYELVAAEEDEYSKLYARKVGDRIVLMVHGVRHIHEETAALLFTIRGDRIRSKQTDAVNK